MRRAEFFQSIWRQSSGMLQPGARIAIIGAGISGLHLAHAFCEKKISVTVFDPRKNGGVRVPLVHACHTVKTRAPLWEKAAEYSRAWYRSQTAKGNDIFEGQNEFGAFFNIRLRPYLRRLRTRLAAQGVAFRYDVADKNSVLVDFELTCVATGAATTLAATRIVPGWESYFSRMGAPATDANIGKNGGKITNYIYMEKRAGFIHRNGETRATATAFAHDLHPAARHALFYGERLTTRDRFPVLGFADSANPSPYLFCAMGYHAMTYAPYLSQAAVAHLLGQTVPDENLICALTPARFLPRIEAQGARGANAAQRGSV